MAQLPNLDRAREMTVAEAAGYFKRHQKKLKVRVHKGPIKSIRTEKHRGHEIKITATYDIRIDGRPLAGHLAVGNDGHVHYHGLPNYTWGSLVDLCKQVIDSFPDDFPPAGRKPVRAAAARTYKTKKSAARKKKTKRATSRTARKGKRG